MIFKNTRMLQEQQKEINRLKNKCELLELEINKLNSWHHDLEEDLSKIQKDTSNNMLAVMDYDKCYWTPTIRKFDSDMGIKDVFITYFYCNKEKFTIKNNFLELRDSDNVNIDILSNLEKIIRLSITRSEMGETKKESYLVWLSRNQVMCEV